ncbi:hypothetical protein ACFVT2_13435 [Streptomyces sp. NPDC058000]|uniref:hypothetical protein n=1 Tax=Streptomyces sp. NPDC058000 TaxID=3346299 RepID=UPI0036E142E8
MGVAGGVDQLGPDADGRLVVGDRVIGYVVALGPYDGTCAEQLVHHQASMVPAPQGPKPPPCCSTPSPHGCPSTHSRWAPARRPSSWAAGAVGGYAVELAKANRRSIVLAYPSDAGHKSARDLGADQVVRRCQGAATDTALLDWSARQAENGELPLRVGDPPPASRDGDPHERPAAAGVRGRLVLHFTNPQWCPQQRPPRWAWHPPAPRPPCRPSQHRKAGDQP